MKLDRGGGEYIKHVCIKGEMKPNASNCVQGGGGLILAIFVRMYYADDPIVFHSKELNNCF